MLEPPARHNSPENVDHWDTEDRVHPEVLLVKLPQVFDYLLRLLLNDSLQPRLSEAKISEMFESKSPVLLPELAVTGDDALQILLEVTASRVRENQHLVNSMI